MGPDERTSQPIEEKVNADDLHRSHPEGSTTEAAHTEGAGSHAADEGGHPAPPEHLEEWRGRGQRGRISRDHRRADRSAQRHDQRGSRSDRGPGSAHACLQRTATPPSTATLADPGESQGLSATALKTDPATASSPPHLAKAAITVPNSAKQAVAATVPTATPVPSATPAATATAAATAIPTATATPAATATALPTATPATQNGGYSLGNSSTAQQPVAATTVS